MVGTKTAKMVKASAKAPVAPAVTNVAGKVLGFEISTKPRPNGGVYLTVGGQEVLTVRPSGSRPGIVRAYGHGQATLGKEVVPTTTNLATFKGVRIGAQKFPNGSFALVVDGVRVGVFASKQALTVRQ